MVAVVAEEAAAVAVTTELMPRELAAVAVVLAVVVWRLRPQVVAVVARALVCVLWAAGWADAGRCLYGGRVGKVALAVLAAVVSQEA